MLSAFRYWRILRLCQSSPCVRMLRIRSISCSFWTDRRLLQSLRLSLFSAGSGIYCYDDYHCISTGTWRSLGHGYWNYMCFCASPHPRDKKKLRWGNVSGTGQSSHYSDFWEQRNHDYTHYDWIQSYSPFCFFGKRFPSSSSSVLWRYHHRSISNLIYHHDLCFDRR